METEGGKRITKEMWGDGNVCFLDCVDGFQASLSKLIRLSILNMCILLCSDHSSIKLEKMLKEEEGERRRGGERRWGRGEGGRDGEGAWRGGRRGREAAGHLELERATSQGLHPCCRSQHCFLRTQAVFLCSCSGSLFLTSLFTSAGRINTLPKVSS